MTPASQRASGRREDARLIAAIVAMLFGIGALLFAALYLTAPADGRADADNRLEMVETWRADR